MDLFNAILNSIKDIKSHVNKLFVFLPAYTI